VQRRATILSFFSGNSRSVYSLSSQCRRPSSFNTLLKSRALERKLIRSLCAPQNASPSQQCTGVGLHPLPYTLLPNCCCRHTTLRLCLSHSNNIVVTRQAILPPRVRPCTVSETVTWFNNDNGSSTREVRQCTSCRYHHEVGRPSIISCPRVSLSSCVRSL
jgi:hypothetical protein